MTASAVLQSISTLFSEAYAGPSDPRSTWFIDNEPDSGILGIIAGLSAAEASWSPKPGDPGTTIASHVEHLRWSLANASDAIEGESYNGNWKESWNMLHADEEAWKRLRDALRAEFERLRSNLQKQDDLPPGDILTGVMALLPHAAYHLGNIRQMVERARAANEKIAGRAQAAE